MNCILDRICLVVVSSMVFLSNGAVLAEDNGFVPMFNGRDMAQWEGKSGWWKVEKGLLTAESTVEKPCTRSHYLYWTGGEPADFEMRCQFRISAAGNSGIQFRSERREDWDTWGYQADMDGAGVYMGCLYQHERGLVAERGQSVSIDAKGQKTIATFAEAAKLLQVVKPEQWNTYRVIAKGSRVSLWINGVKMCEADDVEPRLGLRKGIIALQMHQGPPMKVEYKDLMIRVDDRTDD
ncbi:3-keto-disaccharide hydrolase [Novipirellula artificiosorum]|nr:DUF1080 domain-containing protein [Novipirellula artificiosorum]